MKENHFLVLKNSALALGEPKPVHPKLTSSMANTEKSET